MISTLTLEDSNGVEMPFIDRPARRLQNAQGLAGLTAIRQVLYNRPSRSGSVNRSRYLGDKLITLNGQLTGADPASTWAAFDDLSYVLAQAKATERVLRYTRADGLVLRMLVKADGPLDAPLQSSDAGVVLPYQAQLRASDPNAYTDEQVVVDGQPLGGGGGGSTYPSTYPDKFLTSLGGVVAFDHQGTNDTWPIIRIYGDAVNPIVHLEGDPMSRQIVINGSIGIGDFLELDAGERTVMLDGTLSRSQLLDVANTTWFPLAARSSGTLKLTAQSGSGWLELLFRHAYA